ncbi:MAG TPA: hypothetical protein VF178_12995 [Gemmatimonadaceae bacterium]
MAGPLLVVLAGTGLGAFGSFWTNCLVDRYINGLYHIDAPSLVLAETFLVTVALVAIAGPAWRATRSNPVDALRAV